jgi:hypothetical protein
MAGVNVEDANTRYAVDSATFDHPSSNSGNGLYDVQLDEQNFDTVFTTYAPGYEDKVWDYKYGPVVVMTPVSAEDGGWCDC